MSILTLITAVCRNPTTATEVQIGDNFDKGEFVPGKMVKIMIHGFTSSVNTSHEPCRVLVPGKLM